MIMHDHMIIPAAARRVQSGSIINASEAFKFTHHVHFE